MPNPTKPYVNRIIMTFAYFPHTEDDIRAMLERVGVADLDALYSDVPEDFICRQEYDLPDAMSESEVRRHFVKLAEANRKLTVFCGCGAYDHYAPAVIPYIISRSEFLTAYTPYQPELSQGTLRYIFEFQSMICALTGLDCANASMYDGATAAAEAVMMAVASAKKRNKVLLSSTLLPNVAAVVRTYAKFKGIEVQMIDSQDGETSLEVMTALLAASDVAAVLLPQTNRYGIIENLEGYADTIHGAGALMMLYSDPSSLAVLKSPAEWGADIACGDGQSLGIPLCYGGPYVGFLSCRKDLVRKLPGRVVGATKDVDGKRAFVLTLQAREQHIRREKATSNICSNQSLMALYVTVYMSLMGSEGLREVNELSCAGAHYLHERLLATGKFTPAFDKPFLKEFVLKTSLDAAVLQQALLDAGYFAAVQVEEGLVSFCVTEQRSREEIDSMLDTISSL